jgi:hypothetical protein
MTDGQLYDTWEHALILQKNEMFTEVWALLAMLSELPGHAIAERENLLPEQLMTSSLGTRCEPSDHLSHGSVHLHVFELHQEFALPLVETDGPSWL